MCLPGQNKSNTSELCNVHIHLLLQSWISHLFRTKTLTCDSLSNWQQTFENKTKKMTKAVMNLLTVTQNLQTYLH